MRLSSIFKNLRLKIQTSSQKFQVEATSVNQFDILLRQGYFHKNEDLGKSFVPGSDAAGTIVQKGRQVTGFISQSFIKIFLKIFNKWVFRI